MSAGHICGYRERGVPSKEVRREGSRLRASTFSAGTTRALAENHRPTCLLHSHLRAPVRYQCRAFVQVCVCSCEPDFWFSSGYSASDLQ